MKKKILLYIVIAALSTGLMFQLANNQSKYNFLETSFLHILKNIAEENQPAPPDLAIKNVTLKKVSDPKDYFNYYKYQADIEITNLASDLKNATVVVRSEGMPELALGSDFELVKGGIFTVKDYEVMFDGNFNNGSIEIEIVRTDRDEYYTENNVYQVPVFELPARIDVNALQLLSGEFGGELELMKGESVNARNYQYREILMGGEILSFYEIENSLSTLEDDSWEVVKEYSGEPGYIYLRKTDGENVAVSKIWKFFENNKLSRAEFSKLFVKYAGLDLVDGGVEFFEDVDYGGEYGPYIHTLYNLGLIESDGPLYFPDAPATRSEVLQVVMDYFDADLYSENTTEYSNPYLQALYSSKIGEDFVDSFEPESIATEAYLKNLVNAYK